MILERNRYALMALHASDAAGTEPGTVAASPPDGKVALITVRGAMSESPMRGFFENKLMEGSDVGTWAELRSLAQSADAAVGADGFVVLDVLSGGGTVAGSDTTAATIEGLKATTLLWNAGAANSGMMPLVAAVDHVAGSPMSEFGSMSARFDVLKDRQTPDGRSIESIAADGDVIGQVQELAREWEQFKEANDERLSQIEQKGSADTVTVDKVEKINLDLTRRIDQALQGVEFDPVGQ